MEGQQAQMPQYAETTWLENVIHIDHSQTPQGPVLLITLSNLHRYAIPLFGPLRDYVYRVASPIELASRIPTNGSGTRSPGQ